MTAILAEYSVPQPDYTFDSRAAVVWSVVAFIVVTFALGFAWNRFRDAEQRDLHATKLLFAKSALAATQAKPVALIPVLDVEPEPTEPVVERRGKHRAEGESTDETRVFRVPPALRANADQPTAIGAARPPLNTAHRPQRAGGSVRA